MADTSGSIVLTPDADGKSVDVALKGVQVMVGGKVVPVSKVTPGADMPAVTVVMDTPPASLGRSVDSLEFWALAIPLALVTLLGAAVVYGMVANLTKTLDKLAQLLSEEGSQKMSFSRVQAFIFTYVIAFGSLLIIVHTGTFPTTIPDDLAILSGGSLGTYVVSKAIQTQGNKSKTNGQ